VYTSQGKGEGVKHAADVVHAWITLGKENMLFTWRSHWNLLVNQVLFGKARVEILLT
jgi:hypothetical protein